MRGGFVRGVRALRANQRRLAARVVWILRDAPMDFDDGGAGVPSYSGAHGGARIRARAQARLVQTLESVGGGGFGDARARGRLVVLPPIRGPALLVHAHLLRAFAAGRERRLRRDRRLRAGRVGRSARARAGGGRLRARAAVPSRRIRARDWAGVRLHLSGRIHGAAGGHVQKPAQRGTARLLPHAERRA